MSIRVTSDIATILRVDVRVELDLRENAQFPAFFFVGAVEARNWPQHQGFFRKKEVIPLALLVGTQSQLLKAGVALGASFPDLALQIIGDLFSKRDWGEESLEDLVEYLDVEGQVADHPEREPWDAINPFFDRFSEITDFNVQNLIEWSEVNDSYWKISTTFTMSLMWGLLEPETANELIASSVVQAARDFEHYKAHGLAVEGQLPTTADDYLATCRYGVDSTSGAGLKPAPTLLTTNHQRVTIAPRNPSITTQRINHA